MADGEDMQLQNSYIFLPNPNKKKPESFEDEKGVLHVETGHSLYSHIIKAFPKAKSENVNIPLFQRRYSIFIEIHEKTVEVSVISKNVGDSYYVNVCASGKTKAQIIGALELFHDALFSTEIEEDYISIISYDAISEYYCNKLYPKLSELERNLRKLLFNIYVLNFGREYFQITTTKEMQDKAKSIIRAKGSKAKQETKYIQQFFYSLEYADIQQLLFAPRWTKIDEEKKTAFLNEHTDLSQLSDVELRAVINSISPKSDWERFFAEKFDDMDLEGDIATVRPIRNSVAHCKFLPKEEYIACEKTISKLNRAIIKAITITEEKDFIDNSEAYLKKAFSGVLFRIHELTSKMSETLVPSMQNISEFAKVTSSISDKILGALEVSNALGAAFKNVMDSYLQMPKIDFSGLYRNLDGSFFLNQNENEKGEGETEDEESESDKDV